MKTTPFPVQLLAAIIPFVVVCEKNGEEEIYEEYNTRRNAWFG